MCVAYASSGSNEISHFYLQNFFFITRYEDLCDANLFVVFCDAFNFRAVGFY